MKIIKASEMINNLMMRSQIDYANENTVVNEILNRVRIEGDKALFDYTLKFDKTDLSQRGMLVTQEEIRQEVEQNVFTIGKSDRYRSLGTEPDIGGVEHALW